MSVPEVKHKIKHFLRYHIIPTRLTDVTIWDVVTVIGLVMFLVRTII